MLASRDEFETRVVPLVEVDGETVSSTRIRALVAAGDVEGAMRCLGAPFLLEGEVVDGRQARAQLGFPTANIVPHDEYVFPVTASTRPSPTGCRRRSTWACDRPSRPAAACSSRRYLIDYDADLYGQCCGSRSSRACAARSGSRGWRT